MDETQAERLKNIPEVLGSDWKTPKEIAEELGTSRGLTRAVFYWVSAELDEYSKKCECEVGDVVVYFKRDVKKKGGLYKYLEGGSST